MTQLYRFGPFELDTRAGELRKYGGRIRLQEQPLRILTMLLGRPGEAVLREEIQQALWPNQTVVEFDQGINAAIKRLRTALGDSAANSRYIETLARRGYRFIGTLEPTDPPAAASGDRLPDDNDDLAGKILGHYHVHEMLGWGGMGVVYSAEDLNLGRKVAIKMLHGPARQTDPRSLVRFRREARVAASLSHPNICTIFAVEDFDGEPAIVMEFLAGETLEKRLAHGPLVFDEIRSVAAQMAAALDAGHRTGIVHRDFKPGNIILTPNGVKILDFGLAKAEREDALSADLQGVTKAGAILGTIHYLSPEQAQGNEIDAASDVFAFGAVLYEMCTGAKAFRGDNPASVIAEILRGQPAPLSSLRADLPAALERIVGECLAKDPRQRPTNLSEVISGLEVHAVFVPVSAAVAVRVGGSRPSRRLLLGLASSGALLAAGWRASENFGVFRASPSSMLIYPPGGFLWAGGIALSPDGRHLAAVVADKRGRQLWLRSLKSSSESFLAGTEGGSFPFWSPDSKQIGFFANGKLRSVAASGGPAQNVAGVDSAMGASWAADGKILFGAMPSGRLLVVSAAGGSPRLARGAGNVSAPFLPQFLPGGSEFVFSGWDRGSGPPKALLGRLGSSNPHVLSESASAAQFAPPDYLLFLRSGNLMAQRFDWTNGRPVDEAFAIAGPRLARMASPTTPIIAFSASKNGMLAYRTGPSSFRQRLVWHGRDGSFLRSVCEPTSYMEVFLSRDGRFATVNMGNAHGNLALVDMTTNATVPITSEQPIVYDGVWSPDSRKVAFQIYTPGKTRMMTMTVGDTTPRLLLDDGEGNYPDDWSPDGNWILAHKRTGLDSIVFLQAADGSSKRRVLFKTKAQVDQLQFSPDGYWLAYNSTESSRWEVYVASYPGLTKTIRISNGGGCQPIWRGDSKELFYLTLEGKLMAVPMENEAPQLLGAKELFASRLRPYPGFAQYAADAAGQQFLMIDPDLSAEPPESSEPIHLMADWPAQAPK
jgi:eukaryotic-like serine/threonine-protein kinase